MNHLYHSQIIYKCPILCVFRVVLSEIGDTCHSQLYLLTSVTCNEVHKNEKQDEYFFNPMYIPRSYLACDEPRLHSSALRSSLGVVYVDVASWKPTLIFPVIRMITYGDRGPREKQPVLSKLKVSAITILENTFCISLCISLIDVFVLCFENRRSLYSQCFTWQPLNIELYNGLVQDNSLTHAPRGINGLVSKWY